MRDLFTGKGIYRIAQIHRVHNDEERYNNLVKWILNQIETKTVLRPYNDVVELDLSGMVSKSTDSHIVDKACDYLKEYGFHYKLYGASMVGSGLVRHILLIYVGNPDDDVKYIHSVLEDTFKLNHPEFNTTGGQTWLVFNLQLF